MRLFAANILRVFLYPVILIVGACSKGLNRATAKALGFADALADWEKR